MKKKLIGCSLILFFLFFNSFNGLSKRFPRRLENNLNKDSVNQALDFLKIYYYNKDGWELANPKLKSALRGLLHYIETPPRDTIVAKIDTF